MKNTYETILVIDSKAKIIIFHCIEDSQLNCCTEDSIVFINDDTEIILANGFVYHHVEKLVSSLRQALLGQLILDEGIKKDLGYLFNEYGADICGEKEKKSADLVYTQKNNESYWPGNDYCLWAYDFTSWIYNNRNGSIALEITPRYPYMHCEPEENQITFPMKNGSKHTNRILLQLYQKKLHNNGLNKQNVL